ncbi:DNA fragmentation factor subunit alpha [Scomber japonicus]|uniref:DNA fragmentation factor subunit alpha n=1 Tax=Scomber japonicus TaxID=13676 RepID=UPI002304D432|nr:DNA fragmentation factor subunit alpha [Scomber japonicus]
MTDRKPCKVCNFTRQKSYGLVVPSLDELKIKGCESLGFTSTDTVKVVLEDDGTIVEDDAYFLCLPLNTKFMLLHEKETWSPVRRIDGGTAWMARESMLLETDAVDSSSAVGPWWDLAQQLKQDMASIILMSEADLQTLVDVPCHELASALGFQVKKAEDLQETLQRVLDRREEERQSKELLQLYIKAVEKEDRQQEEPTQPSEGGAGDVDMLDGIEVDSASGFMSRTLMVLKGKTSPETRLSTEDLQMVVTRGVESMEPVLGWDTDRTSALVQACEAELTRRLQQVQALQSIRSTTQPDSTQQSSEKSAEEEGEETPAQGRCN